jgi:hypothetical protein
MKPTVCPCLADTEWMDAWSIVKVLDQWFGADYRAVESKRLAYEAVKRKS